MQKYLCIDFTGVWAKENIFEKVQNFVRLDILHFIGMKVIYFLDSSTTACRKDL